jgi:YebC/PmpR family DNA-binding regulatory protein
MSGHSKWSTIKRQKGANDAKRGQLFSKLAKAISIAAREGGANIDSNQKLRVAVDAARAANMPKANIERAIASADREAADFKEVTYEGFAPGGLGLLIEAATDNRNRTGQGIKNILERNGGTLGDPGSVAFNFESKGLILLRKKRISEEAMLKLIDLGVDEVEETEDRVEVYTSPMELLSLKKSLKEMNLDPASVELVQKPKIVTKIKDARKAKKLLKLLEDLNDHEDVQKVYASFEIV